MQTGNATGAQPAYGSAFPYTEVLTPPMPVSGVRAPLRLSSEEERSNFLAGSITVSAAYDDNMLSLPDRRVGDVSYTLFPTLNLQQTRARWSLDLGYSPGFTFNQRLDERNQSAHDLNLLLGYRVSPHVSLQLHDVFDKTTTLFSSFMGGGNQPGLLQQPNMSMVTPLANRTANTSGLDLTYQFGRDSMVGASGGYYFVNYGLAEDASGQSYALINSRSWNTDGFYAHRFASRHWFGVAYNFQRLMFDPGLRTDVQRTLAFYSVAFGPHMTFSLWGGPERSTGFLATALTGPVSAAHWNGAGGAAWEWRGTRAGLSLGYTRQTSDGGGLAEAVRMQQSNAQIRWRLTQRWTTSLAMLYATNNPLGNSVTPGLRTWSGNTGFDYQMTDHLGFGIRYGRDQQKYLDLTPSLSANRNRAWVSMSYSFGRPLGR